MVNTRQRCINKFTKIKWFHWTSGSILTIIAVLLGCGSHVFHIVEPGETLYSISWMYGHDYRTVAQWNNINSPYILHKGQRLRVAPTNDRAKKDYERVAKTATVRKSVTGSGDSSKAGSEQADKPNKINNQAQQNSVIYSRNSNQKVVWSWPVKEGKVIQSFVANSPGKLGIDVAGKDGQAIYSASNGMVVYSGQGLPLYGKLIIVKHNETYLSAYAHNKKLLVKEGDEVKAGQPIALMGNTGSKHTKLHFEIRRDGKPVDPLHFLPATRPN